MRWAVLRRGEEDRGSAVVLVIGVVGGLVTVLVLALGLVAVLVAGQQARTAADLASLAAAGQLVQGADDPTACALATRVSEQHGVELRGCTVTRQGVSPLPEVTVDVERAVAGTRWAVGVRARAGATIDRWG
ncbi:Rv3654c family TadE-like protein [uncultured Serinicoccus sp.]|uniref:Rv3654c family TadE-like protein n=1 Tax=uncultured Serinicoccus sp. TaxID=735514 RepID=UPI0026369A32|nr:Rv3654c family TadE-like protein [uncultured Serinicoccus sp.]